MSGGFFRGTSADQDTRFSNKQAKLLKSQKFPPELDHLVDTTKVKMDVIRPWIATRATELLGFEDEVLINFVYGLLEGKAVDGKQIQIQLTGFMEKNTGKFMKELWSLLLSAQKNASGVPQQFLDAKEEEMKKKKVESDRITQEIHRRKERGGWEPEQERKNNKMDGKADISGLPDPSRNTASDPVVKQSLVRAASRDPDDDGEVDERPGSRRKSRQSSSPRANEDSSPSHRKSPSAARSSSKSFSHSKSHSGERCTSRSLSVSPRHRRLSPSFERRRRSPPRRSISPWRIPRSPPRRRRRSTSRPRYGSPSLVRRRSPGRRRSPSPSRRRSPPPLRRRSPSPLRRRSPSPLRRRSPSPLRRRSPSPLRRRSPSPLRRRSPPMHRRSPIPIPRRSPSPSRRRSPIRRRTPSRHFLPSPMRRRSPPRSPKHRKRSPIRSPRRRRMDAQNSPHRRNRSRSHSPSNQVSRSLSSDRDNHVNGVDSRKSRDDYGNERKSRDDYGNERPPAHRPSERQEAKRLDSGRKELDAGSRRPVSLRSPHRDPGVERSVDNAVREMSESPLHGQSMKASEKRTLSSSRSPARSSREPKVLLDSPRGTHKEETGHSRSVSDRKRRKYSPEDTGPMELPAQDSGPEDYSPERMAASRSAGQGRPVYRERGTDLEISYVVRNSSEEIEYGPGRLGGESFSPGFSHDKNSSGKREDSFLKESSRPDDKKQRYNKDDEQSLHHSTKKAKRKADHNNQKSPLGSDSEHEGRHKHHTMERGKKSEHQKPELEDKAGYDSQIDDPKEAKRKRKEEKKLRKEEKRRKREERHRRKEERRAGKLKAKYMDTVTPPSDSEKSQNAVEDSDGGTRKDTNIADTEAESEQKILEIQLREKALESLRAKKAVTH